MSDLKWEEIAEKLREKILSGQLKAGEDFPTNLELMREFNVHSGTIQNAVNALIREGLVSSYGSGMVRRKIRPLLERTIRNSNYYSKVNSENEKFRLEHATIIRSFEKIPEPMLSFRELLKFPALYINASIYRNDIPVGLSNFLFNGYLPTDKLYKILKDPDMELGIVMNSSGVKPIYSEEYLVATLPSSEEKKNLNLPSGDLTPITRVKRLTYDGKDRLLEISFLIFRGDCYENYYRCPIKTEL